jgi:Domain of unknown function (DUF1998)
MIDFPKDEALMTAGLDVWPLAGESVPAGCDWEIREERLEARLRVSHFRAPPDFREEDPNEKLRYQRVPFVRFPSWQYCHHCGGMTLGTLFDAKRRRCDGYAWKDGQSCAARPEKRRPELIPVRFVAACADGHIQDFPFHEFVHRDKPWDFADHRLRLRAGRSSGGLTGILIDCTCGEKRVLGNVFAWKDEEGGPLEKLGCKCRGLHPWLGQQEGSATCDKPLRVVQRGASNVYFAHVVSSLYLPLWAAGGDDRSVLEALEQPHIWRTLTQITANGKIDPMAAQMVAMMLGVDVEKLRNSAQRKLDGVATSKSAATQDEEQYRHSEYQALVSGAGDEKSELFVASADLASYGDDIRRFFRRIQLVHKLRETRALAGFTRLLPPDGDLSSPRMRPLKVNPAIDWLPAVKVLGEGIFLELNPDVIARWLKEYPKVADRTAQMGAIYNAARVAREQEPRKVTPKLVLLHTIAHALINQLSFDCGYGSASLRERLYCDLAHPESPMQGILIYTASGDADGTMGGLVRQGRGGRFEPTLRRAIAHAAWCSSDPVCIESNGQGTDNANLAACHGCCLLPETSCETGNRLLDRALLVGTPTQPEFGFLKSLLEADA